MITTDSVTIGAHPFSLRAYVYPSSRQAVRPVRPEDRSHVLRETDTMIGEALSKPSPKILLFRNDRLGDLILSFPVVESLRKVCPSAQIDLFVHAKAVPLAALQGNVRYTRADTFFGLKGLVSLISWLRRESYTVAIHLYPRPRLALASFLARIPVRVGTQYRYYSFLFNRRVPVSRSKSNRHERDLNLELLRGLSVPPSPVEAGIQVPPEARRELAALLQENGIHAGSAYIVLHPGSGGSSLNWPAEFYGRLARDLFHQGFQVIVTGSHQDGTAVKQCTQSSGPGIVDLSRRLDLIHLAALVEGATLVITNSTAPLHLADALGTRVLGLYTPVLGALPERWGPYHQLQNTLLPLRTTCPRCTREKCEHHNCMRLISPEEVLKRVLEMQG